MPGLRCRSRSPRRSGDATSCSTGISRSGSVVCATAQHTEEPSRRTGYRSALANARVRRLLIGYLPFSLSTAMDKIAIVWIAAQLAPADKSLAISGVTIAYLVPGVLVNVVFGRWLATVPSARLTIANSLNKCCFLVVAGVLHSAGVLTLPVLLGCLGVASLTGSFGRAAWQSAIRDSARPDELFAANSLFSTASQAGFMAGPALGGVLIAAIGAGPVLILDGLAYLSVLAAVVSVRGASIPTGTATPHTPDDKAAVAERSALRMAWVLVGATAVFYALYGPLIVQLPVKLMEDFAMSDTDAARSLGYAWSAVGAGSAVTGLVLGTRKSLARPVWAAAIVFGWGVATVVVAVAPNLPVVVAGLLLGGLVFAPYSTIVITILQQSLSRAGFDSVNMYYAAVLNGAQPVGVAAAGALGVVLGAGPILTGTGILLMVTGLLVALLTSHPMTPKDSRGRAQADH
ncbi:MFS transporter [Streptomyces xanthophaeus]|uniref:MFS transporter n=1 Tax=Streptomyces xanthophaeus TaxID=67385 RepID=UPI002FEE236E